MPLTVAHNSKYRQQSKVDSFHIRFLQYHESLNSTCIKNLSPINDPHFFDLFVAVLYKVNFNDLFPADDRKIIVGRRKKLALTPAFHLGKELAAGRRYFEYSPGAFQLILACVSVEEFLTHFHVMCVFCLPLFNFAWAGIFEILGSKCFWKQIRQIDLSGAFCQFRFQINNYFVLKIMEMVEIDNPSFQIADIGIERLTWPLLVRGR